MWGHVHASLKWLAETVEQHPIIRANGLKPVEALHAVLYACTSGFLPSLIHSALYNTGAVEAEFC